MEGAESNWEVRRVTFNELDKRVSNVVAEPRSLQTVRLTDGKRYQCHAYLETSCSSDPL